MFYHYILNENEDSLINKFYKSQLKNPYKGDWTTTVEDNLEEIGIMLTEDQIKECSQAQFKTLVDKRIENEALTYLNAEKESKSKVCHINYDKLEMQKYLRANKHTNKVGKFMFLARSRMLDLAENFKKGEKNSKTQCPICEEP